MVINDSTIKAKIKERLQTADSQARIVTRQKLALKEKDWKAALRSLNVDGVINGWMITRSGIRVTKLGNRHFQYEWDYTLLYFRSMYDKGEADNSEVVLAAVIEAAISEFEQHGKLDFDEDYEMLPGVILTFDNHGELQIEASDTINSELHFVQARLTCYLTKQG